MKVKNEIEEYLECTWNAKHIVCKPLCVKWKLELQLERKVEQLKYTTNDNDYEMFELECYIKCDVRRIKSIRRYFFITA